jgi:hypothetical protein
LLPLIENALNRQEALIDFPPFRTSHFDTHQLEEKLEWRWMIRDKRLADETPDRLSHFTMLIRRAVESIGTILASKE